MNNLRMLKSFFKVILGNEMETELIIPDMYVKDVYNIDFDYLKEKKITNLIFDIDNTILEVNSLDIADKLINFFRQLEKAKFNVCILSNNGKERVYPVAKTLKTKYIYKASKPSEESYKKALKALNAKKENTAMIGDQMLTDIKGSNEFGIFSILVDPVADKYDIKTGVSRMLQNIMINELEKKNKFQKNKHYKERRY